VKNSEHPRTRTACLHDLQVGCVAFFCIFLMSLPTVVVYVKLILHQFDTNDEISDNSACLSFKFD